MIFSELYPAVIHSLESIASDSFDNEVSDKADGFKYRVRTLEFIGNLKILENILGHTFRLSVILQSKEVEIVSCAQLIVAAQTNLQQLLNNSQNEFSKIFTTIIDLLKKHDIPLVLRTSRQGPAVTLADPEAAEKHLRESHYQPLLRKTIEELEERFGSSFNYLLNFFALIPHHMVTAADAGMKI